MDGYNFIFPKFWKYHYRGILCWCHGLTMAMMVIVIKNKTNKKILKGHHGPNHDCGLWPWFLLHSHRSFMNEFSFKAVHRPWVFFFHFFLPDFICFFSFHQALVLWNFFSLNIFVSRDFRELLCKVCLNLPNVWC